MTNVLYNTLQFPFSSPEVPLVLLLFLLISLVWLWAGLHMAYRYLWLLILYVILNCLLVSLFFYIAINEFHQQQHTSCYVS